jgi:hypothetical protein
VGLVKLSQFTDAVMGEIKEDINRSIDNYMRHCRPSHTCLPSIPLDLEDTIPKGLTEAAVTVVIAELHGGGEDGSRDAEKLITVFPVKAILVADRVLDNLNLVGTPEPAKERLEAITDLLDLNYSLQGSYDFERSLIGIMSDYWDQVPVFYGDLQPVFKTMKRLYKNHPKTSGYMDWTAHYDFRDGILDVTENLLTKYGVRYDGFANEEGFGIKYMRERFILPGVSGAEYMETLCRVNLEIADADVWPYHLRGEDVRAPEDGNLLRNAGWREALYAARDRKLGKGNETAAHDDIEYLGFS